MTGAKQVRRTGGGVWLALAFAAVSAAILWSPSEGLRPILISDASEYSISAARFVEGKGFTVGVDGNALPPRYPVGFPLAFLAPVYAIAGTAELGRGVWAVLASAVLALLLIRLLCHRVLPSAAAHDAELAAWLALAVIVAVDSFRETAEVIMADLPLLLTCVVACLAFVGAWHDGRARWFLLGGLAASLALSIRLTGLAFVLPFALTAWRRRGSGKAPLLATLGPLTATLAALATFNTVIFGSPFFHGYDYWLGAAPEVIGLGVSRVEGALFVLLMPFEPAFGYGEDALWTPASLALASLMLVPAALALACRRHRAEVWERTRPVLVFLALGPLPVTLFHLLFAVNSRYHLPFQVLWLASGCLWAGALLAGRLRLPAALAVAGAVVASLAAYNPWADPAPEASGQRVLLDAADRAIPADGVLVGTVSGVLADRFFVGETARRFVPLNPFSPYAAFLVGGAGEERVPSFAATGWHADRIDALFAGHRIFLQRDGSADAREFEKRYASEPVAATELLAELRPVWRPLFRLGFGAGSEPADPYLREGWQPTEWGHPFGRFRFGLGARSTLAVPVDAQGPLLLQLVLGPSPSGHQALVLEANGVRVAELELDAKFRQYSFPLPEEAMSAARELELAFLRPGAALPPADQLSPTNPAHFGAALLWFSVSACDDTRCAR